MKQSPVGPLASFFPPFLVTTSSSLELEEEEEDSDPAAIRVRTWSSMSAKNAFFQCLVSFRQSRVTFRKCLAGDPFFDRRYL